MAEDEAPPAKRMRPDGPSDEAGPSSSLSFQVFVKGVRARLVVLEVMPSTTVMRMLDQLCEAVGLGGRAMRASLVLTWRGRSLSCDDDRTLMSLGITRDATIDAHWTVRGAPLGLEEEAVASGAVAVGSLWKRRDVERLDMLVRYPPSLWALHELVQLITRFQEGNDLTQVVRCLGLVVTAAKTQGVGTGQVMLDRVRLSEGYDSSLHACEQLLRVAGNELADMLSAPEACDLSPSSLAQWRGLRLYLVIAAGAMDAARGLPALWAASPMSASERARLDAAAAGIAQRHGVWHLCRPLLEEGASKRALGLFTECSKVELASLEGLSRAVGGHAVLEAMEGLLTRCLKETTREVQLLTVPAMLSNKSAALALPQRHTLTLNWLKFLPLYAHLRRSAPRQQQQQQQQQPHAQALAAGKLLASLQGAFVSCKRVLTMLDALGLSRSLAGDAVELPMGLTGLLPAALCKSWDMLAILCHCLRLVEAGTPPEHRAAAVKAAEASARTVLEHQSLKSLLSSYDTVYVSMSSRSASLPARWPEIVLSCIPLATKRERVETFFPPLAPPGEEDEGVTVVINRRANIIAQSEWQLRDVVAVREGLTVLFQDEDGHGNGVVLDWLTELCSSLFNPAYGLFTASAADMRVLHPNPAAAQVVLDPAEHLTDPQQELLKWFRFAGVVAGLALRARLPLGCFVSDACFKMMLGQEPGLCDLAQLFPEVARSCQQLLSSDAASLEAMHLHFVAVDEGMGDAVDVELVPGGTNKSVTLENVSEYVGLLAKHYCCRGSSQAGATAFAQGLLSMSDAGVSADFKLFARHLLAADFNSILGGSAAELDVADWRAHTDAKGFGEREAVCCFWECVEALTPAQRRQLLRFWTGLQSVPVGGFRDLQRLELIRDENPEHTLPSAHTCFRQLMLPVPEHRVPAGEVAHRASQRRMLQALLQALAHGAVDGFGMA